MSKVLSLDYENEHDYALIGIHTALEDYRLAFYLNTNLDIQLKRASQDLDFSTDFASFSLYTFDCNITFSSWSLIANKHVFKADTQAIDNSLFKENYQTSILIQEKKQLDYFLKIESDFNTSELGAIVSKIKNIATIITCYSVNPQTLKSKDFLIF